ncbi:MAG: DUF2249 domain-containing protein [Burkholderiales bacterium]|nr:DUF2249 domain-containing protein [Burkholderiales bacterium]
MARTSSSRVLDASVNAPHRSSNRRGPDNSPRAFGPAGDRQVPVNGSEVVVVDARWLQHPEPMEKVLAALSALTPGQRLLFKIHREPYPLYRMLEKNNYGWKVAKQDDGTFEITIWEQ